MGYTAAAAAVEAVAVVAVVGGVGLCLTPEHVPDPELCAERGALWVDAAAAVGKRVKEPTTERQQTVTAGRKGGSEGCC